MPPVAHLKLLAMAVAVWAAFWVLGWPEYYQQYATAPLAIGCALLLLAIAALGWRSIARRRPERRLARAAWLSFYFTVPLAALDTAYCGVHLGHGAAFLWRYWYLSSFYVLPWLIWIPMGMVARRGAPATSPPRPASRPGAG